MTNIQKFSLAKIVGYPASTVAEYTRYIANYIYQSSK